MQNDTVTNLYTATDSNQDSNSEVGSTDEYNLTKGSTNIKSKA